jgi:sulfonate transport system ATP-binding protein
MTAVLYPSSPEAPANVPAGAVPSTPALPVSFRGLRRTFGSGIEAHTVLRDVSFDVRPGEVLAILGTSGCGKSTLLRATAGLDAPSSGSVEIDGVPVQGVDSRCAFAFQEPRLLPWHTLQANIAIGLPAGVSARDGKAKVARLLELVGLQDFAKHRPREVSGGMAQRASLARALARNPGVLLLDEPFGALDALTRIKMQDLLLDVHRAEPTTVLLVTHDVDEALQLADRIIVLGKEPAPAADPAGAGKTGGSGTPAPAAAPGAMIVRTVVVPGERPRDRASAELARMRASLLASLGVDGH